MSDMKIVKASSVRSGRKGSKKSQAFTELVDAMKTMKPGDAFACAEFHLSYVIGLCTAINTWTGSRFHTFTGNDGLTYITLEE